MPNENEGSEQENHFIKALVRSKQERDDEAAALQSQAQAQMLKQQNLRACLHNRKVCFLDGHL